MTAKEALPAFYAISELKDQPFWDTEFDPGSEACFDILYNLFDIEMALHQDNERCLQVTKAIVNDIIDFRKANDDKAIACNFLQFLFSSHLTFYLVNNKLAPYAFDWIANALDDEISNDIERTTGLDRIETFVSADHPFIIKEFDYAFCLWVYSVFYYSRTTAGHAPLGEEILRCFGKFYFAMPARGIITYQFVLSIAQILAWCIENNNETWIKKSVQLLQRINDDQTLPMEWKKDILLQFSCISQELSGQPQEVWAGQVLEKYNDQLFMHQRLHVWVNFTANSSQKILANMNAFMSSIDEYHKGIRDSGADKSLLVYELTQIYSILQPTILQLLKEGYTEAAEQLFSYYFTVTNFVKQPVLHIIPNDPDGVVYNAAGQTVIIPNADIKASIMAITVQTNIFLQLTNVIKGNPGYQPEAVNEARMGTPVEAEAGKYLSRIQDHFKFDVLQGKMNLADVKGYYFHNGINFPLKPVILKDTGVALPMSLSFQQPEEQRAIKKILLWQGDSLFSEQECTGLEMIFKKCQIETTLFSYQTHTVANFIEAYESDFFDAIIVSGHGTYKHYEPYQSYIHLSDEMHLGIGEMKALKINWSNRRLLFLNICDGATTALLNSPLSLGISSHIVHSKQALFSHMWPVNPRVAFLISWLVAAGLAKGQSYAAIYAETLLTLIKGKQEVHDRLKELLDSELLESILNIEIDLSNFTHWGSFAYFE